MSDWPTNSIYARRRDTTGQVFQSGCPAIVKLDTVDFDSGGVAVTTATNLTGTVAKTAASATLTGTGTLFTTELAVGDWIQVPGTQNERRQVVTITNNLSLAVTGANFVYSASGQTGVKVLEALKAVEAGIYIACFEYDWDTGTTGYRETRVYVNGADASGTFPQFRLAGLSAGLRACGAGLLQLSAGDLVTLVNTHTQAADVTAGGGVLSIAKLSN
jgi:hypothetical protein